MKRALLIVLVALALWLPQPVWAAELSVSDLQLAPCPEGDAGAQPDLKRPVGASCYALRGVVHNPGKRAVVDADLFAQIFDRGGEPCLLYTSDAADE